MSSAHVTDPSLGWGNSATCRATESNFEVNGLAFGQAESGASTLARVLLLQARQRFGREEAESRSRLDVLGAGHAVEELLSFGEALFDASDWVSWLAAATAPAVPEFPDSARDLDMDFAPTEPSIDSFFKTSLPDGSKVVFHLRLQKWYQPDLDRVIFLEQQKVIRLQGCRCQSLVFMMWPLADGLGATGAYTGKDDCGKVQSIKYIIRKAWEMEPEEALATGPGGLMLVPLTRGAKSRMSELVERMKEVVAARKPDEKTLSLVWVSIYWTMGMVCTAEEAEAFLGTELMAFIRSSKDYISVTGRSFLEGYQKGTALGPTLVLRQLVKRQGTRRFGESPEAQAILDQTSSADHLEAMALRALAANDWSFLKPVPSPIHPPSGQSV